jgi:hypothetical protein
MWERFKKLKPVISAVSWLIWLLGGAILLFTPDSVPLPMMFVIAFIVIGLGVIGAFGIGLVHAPVFASWRGLFTVLGALALVNFAAGQFFQLQNTFWASAANYVRIGLPIVFLVMVAAFIHKRGQCGFGRRVAIDNGLDHGRERGALSRCTEPDIKLYERSGKRRVLVVGNLNDGFLLCHATGHCGVLGAFIAAGVEGMETSLSHTPVFRQNLARQHLSKGIGSSTGKVVILYLLTRGLLKERL